MTRLVDIEQLLTEAARKTNHRNFVVIGSLSIIGAVLTPPEDMTTSVDVDAFLKLDPNRHEELRSLDDKSDAMQRFSCYADPVSPSLVSAPDGWMDRLVPIQSSSGIVIWFMDPVDAATSKLIRGEERDILWVSAGIAGGLIPPERLREWIRKTENVLDGECAAALTRLSGIEENLVSNEMTPKT